MIDKNSLDKAIAVELGVDLPTYISKIESVPYKEAEIIINAMLDGDEVEVERAKVLFDAIKGKQYIGMCNHPNTYYDGDFDVCSNCGCRFY